jgi:hypothetical protein
VNVGIGGTTRSSHSSTAPQFGQRKGRKLVDINPV